MAGNIAQKTFLGNDGRMYRPGMKVPETYKVNKPGGGTDELSNDLGGLQKNDLVGTEVPAGEKMRAERRNKMEEEARRANKTVR